MLMAVKKNFDLILAYFKYNLSASMEYRVSFLFQTFGMFLNNASFAFFWWVLITRVGSIGGYGFEDVMMLWALTSCGFGIMSVVFGNVPRICDMILKGELDSYLLQPKNVLINVIASGTRISGWGDIIYGLALFVAVKSFGDGGLTFWSFVLFLLFSVTAALLFSSVIITFNSLAFFFGDVASIAGLGFEFIITLSIYPASIYKGLVRFIVFSVLPAGFISFIPSLVIKEYDIKMMLSVIGMTAVWVFVAFFTFNKGLKKYESGNLIVQKL